MPGSIGRVRFALAFWFSAEMMLNGGARALPALAPTRAATEKPPCTLNVATRSGVLKYPCMELPLSGDISSTVEKLTRAAATTTIIVTSCSR